MKNNFKWIVLVVLLVLGAVGFFIFNKTNSKNSLQSSEKNSPTLKAIAVTTLEKGVFLKTSSDSLDIEVEHTATTSAGQVVKTSTSGRGLIEWPLNHPTLLDYSSQISIVDTNENGKENSLELISGEIWSRTKNSAEKGETFQLKTGNAVAVIRGTSFGLSFQNNVTALLVTEGSVSLYKKDIQTGEALLNTEILVTAGKKGVVENNGNPKLGYISIQDKKMPWYVYNNKIKESSSSEPRKATASSTPTIKPKVVPTSVMTPTQTSQPITTTTLSGTGSSVTPSGGSTANTPQVKETLSVTSVAPRSIAEGDGKTFVVLTGTGFSSVMDLAIEEIPVPNFEILSDTSARFTIGNLLAGTYTMYFTLKDQNFFTIPQSLYVTSSTRQIQ